MTENEKQPWFERAIIIFAISVLVGVFQNIYSKMDEVNNNLDHCSKKESITVLWNAYKEVQQKQNDLYIQVRLLEAEIKKR